MDNYLYQIENDKSGRRVIYKGFDKIEWSPGEGEDGTFFTEDQMPFVLNLVEWPGPEISIIRYEKKYFGEWPIREKSMVLDNNFEDLDKCPF